MADILQLAPAGRDVDLEFFNDHRDRQTHIRTAFDRENQKEFRELGFHDARRRRILMWRVPEGSAAAVGGIVKIPFLAFADEEIRDDDATLLPILHEVMGQAAADYGMVRRGS